MQWQKLARLVRWLTKLDLYGCDSIAADTFACLSFLTSLEELNVIRTSINDDGFRAISTSLTRLTKLYLFGCNLNTAEAGFTCLSSLTSLEELNVRETNISDEVFCAISTSLTRLAKLDLRGCRYITADAFACLSFLTLLEDLNVSRTNIPGESLLAIWNVAIR